MHYLIKQNIIKMKMNDGDYNILFFIIIVWLPQMHSDAFSGILI